jgi:hypothetical protein
VPVIDTPTAPYNGNAEKWSQDDMEMRHNA